MGIFTAVEIFIEDELKKAWGAVVGAEQVVVKDAAILWADAKPLLTSFVPSEYALIKALFLRVVMDVATGNIADIETAMLNAASDTEKALITRVGSPLLQALLAMLKAAHV